MLKKTLLAAGGALALAVPAVVVAGGDPVVTGQLTNNEQAVWNTSGPVATNNGEYKPIKDIPQGVEIDRDYQHPTTIQVSVDMRAGKAQLRLTDEITDDGHVIVPDSVLLSEKGVSTATFILREGDLERPILEWKRLGDQKAEAESVVVQAMGLPD